MCRVLKCKRARGRSCFCQYVQELMEVYREPSFSSWVSAALAVPFTVEEFLRCELGKHPLIWLRFYLVQAKG